MPHSLDLRIVDVQRMADTRLRGLWEFMILAKAAFDDLLEARTAAGGNDTDFARILFGLGRTNAVQLDVNATTGVITATDGFSEFSGFEVGRRATLSGFANAGNNASFLVTAATGITITVDDPGAALVTETGTGDEMAKMDPFQEEIDKVVDYKDAFIAANDINTFFTGGAPATADREPDFQRVLSI